MNKKTMKRNLAWVLLVVGILLVTSAMAQDTERVTIISAARMEEGSGASQPPSAAEPPVESTTPAPPPVAAESPTESTTPAPAESPMESAAPPAPPPEASPQTPVSPEASPSPQPAAPAGPTVISAASLEGNVPAPDTSPLPQAAPPQPTPEPKRSIVFSEEDKSTAVTVPEELTPYIPKLTAATAEILGQDDENVVGEFIIAFTDQTGQAKRDRALENIAQKKQLPGFNGAKITASVKDAKELLKNKNVQYVEIDQAMNLSAPQEEVPWGVQRVLSPVAWNETLGDKVKVAVLDSGIAPHKDLKIKGGTAIVGNDYTDTYGHGTEVAGVIAAQLDNKGIIGNAPKADLYAVRITDGGTGKLSDAIAGLQWAIDNNMDIASMSFGFPSYSQIFKEKVQEAYGQGMLLIAASGNDGDAVILYPAKYTSVIAVGATTEGDTKASFSNYGSDLELVAPGEGIKTTALEGEYATVSGTSYAVPHVTGVAALIKADYPTLTNAQIRQKLRDDAFDLGPPGRDAEYGYGLVQFKFGGANISPSNDSYYYELFNITWDDDLKVYTYWINGTGSIDDVDYQPGDYLAVKYNTDPPTQEEFRVDENQTFTLLAFNEIGSKDNFTSDSSQDNDFRTWKDWQLNVSYSNPKPDMDAYCFDLDFNGTFGPKAYDLCRWVDNDPGEDDKASCGTFSSSFGNTDDRYVFQHICFDDPGGNCTQDKPAGTEQFLLPTASIKKGTVKMRFYQECDQDVPFKRGTQIDQDYTYIFNRRRALCDGSDPFLYRYQGLYNDTHDKWDRYKLNSCAGNKECDPALDEQNVTDPVAAIPDVCRLKDGEGCSNDNECLTGHGCIDGFCGGVAGCNATIQAITEDRDGNPLDGLQVFIDDNLMGNTALGFLEANVTGACTRKYNVTVWCNATTWCGEQLITINANNQSEGLEFDCSICKGEADLYIEEGDIIVDEGDSPPIINATVRAWNTVANNLKVRFLGIGVDNQLVFQQDATIPLLNPYSSTSTAIQRDLTNVHKVLVQIDPDNAIDEPKKNNFLAARPQNVFRQKAFFQIGTGLSKVNQELKKFYSKFYREVPTEAQASTVLAVGHPRTNAYLKDQMHFTRKKRGWSVNQQGLGRMVANGKVQRYPHTGLIDGYVNENNKPVIAVVGNELDGMLTATELLGKMRRIYQTNLFQSKKVNIIRDTDFTALANTDYLRLLKNKPLYGKDTDDLKKVASSVLEERKLEKLVQIIQSGGVGLRINRLYEKEATTKKTKNVQNEPLVFSGGMFADINRWEGTGGNPKKKDGLAVELANAGRDVWEIEISGGHGNDCLSCPNYNYLTQYKDYWSDSINFILDFTKANKIDYVAHSQGCRAALDALKDGYVNSNKIDTFIGLGCIGAFEGDSVFIHFMKKNGKGAIKAFENEGKFHITFWQALIRIGWPPALVLDAKDTKRISLNLFKQYEEWVSSPSDSQPGSGINSDNFLIIHGDLNPFGFKNNDRLVPTEDANEIFQNVNSPNKEKCISSHKDFRHDFMPDKDINKKLIKKFLKDKTIEMECPQ